MPNFSPLESRSCVKLRYAPSWLSNQAAISRETGHNAGMNLRRGEYQERQFLTLNFLSLLSLSCAGWDPLPREIYNSLSARAKPHLAHAAVWDESGLEENPGWRDKNPNG